MVVGAAQGTDTIGVYRDDGVSIRKVVIMMTMCDNRENPPYAAGIVVLLCVSLARGGTIRRVCSHPTAPGGRWQPQEQRQCHS